VSAASASDRVFGVSPDGVAGAKSPLLGGRRESCVSPMVRLYSVVVEV
jgi:hypothetical protein